MCDLSLVLGECLSVYTVMLAIDRLADFSLESIYVSSSCHCTSVSIQIPFQAGAIRIYSRITSG